MYKILFLFLLLPVIIFAQELEATVTVNYEQLSTAAKERLEGFGQAVENYLNNNNYTGEEWEGDPIKCSFNIFFNAEGGETNYSAQIVVVSQRPIYKSPNSSLMFRIQDSQWSFKYEKNQSLYFNQTFFDPLLSFLDFYAHVIIGLDLDSFDRLGGSDMFIQALDIAVLGASTGYKETWSKSSLAYNKRTLIDNLLSADFRQFREDYFDYHFNGIDLMSTEPEEGYKNIVKLVKHLETRKDNLDPRNVLLKIFFEAKSSELVDALKDYPDTSILEILKKVDPQHSSKYDKALGNI